MNQSIMHECKKSMLGTGTRSIAATHPRRVSNAIRIKQRRKTGLWTTAVGTCLDFDAFKFMVCNQNNNWITLSFASLQQSTATQQQLGSRCCYNLRCDSSVGSRVFLKRLFQLLFSVVVCLIYVSATATATAHESLLLNAELVTRRTFEVGGFVDSESCWQNLQASDTGSENGNTPDGYVDRTEYIQFAKAESPPGTISPDVTDFEELPQAYQLAYLAAACLCNNPDFGGDVDDKACCLGLNGKIRVPPPPSSSTNNNTSQGEAAYLYATCVLTSTASETVLTSPAPSASPSSRPSKSTMPSIEPTVSPSSVPSTSPKATTSPTPPSTPSSSSADATVTFQISIKNGMVLLQDQSFQTEYLSNVQVGLNRLAQSMVPSSGSSETIVTSTTTTSDNSSTADQKSGSSRHTRHLQTMSETDESFIVLQLPTILSNVTTTDCPANGGPLVSNVGEKDAISVNITSDVCQTIVAIVQLLVVSSPPPTSTVTTKAEKTILAPAIKFENDLYNAIYDGLYQQQLDSIYRDQGELSSPIIVLTGYIPQTPTTQGGDVPGAPSISPPSGQQINPNNKPSNVETNGSLSPGSLSAIVIGASAFALLPIILYLANRMKKADDDNDDEYSDSELGQRKPPDYQEYQPDHDDEFMGSGPMPYGGRFHLPGDSTSLASNSQYTDGAIKSVGSGGPGLGAIAVGAGVGAITGGAAAAANSSLKNKKSSMKKSNNNANATYEYGKGGHGSKKVMEAMKFVDEGDDIVAEPGAMMNIGNNNNFGIAVGAVGGVGLLLAADSRDRNSKNSLGAKDTISDDASSNAGSSGWSSSAGISSLNTGSIDDSSDIAAAAGATLAGIGLASSTYRQNQQQQQQKQQRQTRRKVNVTSPTNNDELANKAISITTDEDDDAFRSAHSHNTGVSSDSAALDDDSDDDDDEIAKNLSDHNGAFGTQIQSDVNIGRTGDVTRDHLDALIESGDWAAVGATAALLAAASDSQSASTRNTGGGNKSIGSRGSSVDAARAAELDHLVDAGDWEGVVKAAAKFEAASVIPNEQLPPPVVATATMGTGDLAVGSSSGGGSRSRTNSSQDSSVDSADGTGTFTGTFDPTLSTSVSDDPSRVAKLAEYRAEVEALVRRVVPEEIDNVDEMMKQFKGREEELVETLRTMQERAVAQKARQAGQKSAKLEARRNVQRGVVPGTSAVAQRVATLESSEATSAAVPIPPVTAQSSAKSKVQENAFVPTELAMAGFSTMEATAVAGAKDAPSARTSIGSTESARRKRTALDAAIDAGDWEAVRDTAAALSVSSSVASSTMASSEIERLANTNLSTTSSEGTATRLRQSHGVNSERATELDAMIGREDWDAVVNMASRYVDEDKRPITNSLLGLSGQPSSSSKISKEEEEALREAELWMKIAEQKKAEGALDAGASEAAEWAIQRSLSQLREADKRVQSHQTKNSSTVEEDEV